MTAVHPMTGAEVAAIAAELTKAQRTALTAVCRSNGGGVGVSCRVVDDEVVPSNPAYRKLFALGLIQGKAGSYSTVVHTRHGLDLYRQHILSEKDSSNG